MATLTRACGCEVYWLRPQRGFRSAQECFSSGRGSQCGLCDRVNKSTWASALRRPTGVCSTRVSRVRECAPRPTGWECTPHPAAGRPVLPLGGSVLHTRRQVLWFCSRKVSLWGPEGSLILACRGSSGPCRVEKSVTKATHPFHGLLDWGPGLDLKDLFEGVSCSRLVCLQLCQEVLCPNAGQEGMSGFGRARSLYPGGGFQDSPEPMWRRFGLCARRGGAG